MTPPATTTPPATSAAQVRQRAGLDVLAWPVFDAFAVDVMVTTRAGGVSGGPYASLNLSLSAGDDPAAVLENRRRAARAIGAAPGDFVFARQVHGTGTHVVRAADRGAGTLTGADAIPATDALVTRDPGSVLTVLAADCVPIVLYDPAAHVLACVHAGWRGTVGRVAQAAVATMVSLGAAPGGVVAGIGPAIAAEAYQVGHDVAAAVRQAFPHGHGGILSPDGSGRWLLDLWEANRLTLREAGLPDGQIHTAGLPTGPGPGLFFSHRARRGCGRFALAARLRPRGER